jgi:hypothetical protein
MSSVNVAHRAEGITLHQAALIARIAYLLMPVTVAEFFLCPSWSFRATSCRRSRAPNVPPRRHQTLGVEIPGVQGP